MKRISWKWVYDELLDTVTHNFSTTQEEGWKEVELAPDEKVYWTGRPERFWLRWGMLFPPLFGGFLLLIVFVAQAPHTFGDFFMRLMVLAGSLACFVVPAVGCYRLGHTRYLLTDRRIVVDDVRRKIRWEYDMISYLKDYEGWFPQRSWMNIWQMSNRWDIRLMHSTNYQSSARNAGMVVQFKSVPREVLTIARQAEPEIRQKHNAPNPWLKNPFRIKIVRTGVCDIIKRKKQLKREREQASKQQ